MGVSKNITPPQIIQFNRVFHYKPSILGYTYFWKHPYGKKVDSNIHIEFFCYNHGPEKWDCWL